MNRWTTLALSLVFLAGPAAAQPDPAQSDPGQSDPSPLAGPQQDVAEKGAATGQDKAQDSAQDNTTETLGDLSHVQSIVIDRGVTKLSKSCIECHKLDNPGIISDWKRSRHAHVGVTCLDCHQVSAARPTPPSMSPSSAPTPISRCWYHPAHADAVIHASRSSSIAAVMSVPTVNRSPRTTFTPWSIGTRAAATLSSAPRRI